VANARVRIIVGRTQGSSGIGIQLSSIVTLMAPFDWPVETVRGKAYDLCPSFAGVHSVAVALYLPGSRYPSNQPSQLYQLYVVDPVRIWIVAQLTVLMAPFQSNANIKP